MRMTGRSEKRNGEIREWAAQDIFNGDNGVQNGTHAMASGSDRFVCRVDY